MSTCETAGGEIPRAHRKRSRRRLRPHTGPLSVRANNALHTTRLASEGPAPMMSPPCICVFGRVYVSPIAPLFASRMNGPLVLGGGARVAPLKERRAGALKRPRLVGGALFHSPIGAPVTVTAREPVKMMRGHCWRWWPKKLRCRVSSPLVLALKREALSREQPHAGVGGVEDATYAICVALDPGQGAAERAERAVAEPQQADRHEASVAFCCVCTALGQCCACEPPQLHKPRQTFSFIDSIRLIFLNPCMRVCCVLPSLP